MVYVTKKVRTEQEDSVFAVQVVNQKLPMRKLRKIVGEVISTESKEKDIPSKWMKRLDDISNLQKGWDGHGGRPISRDVIETSRILLIELYQRIKQMPRILAGGDGTMEITYDDSDFEIFIEGSNSVGIEHNGRDIEIGNDYSLLGRYVDKNIHTIFKVNSE